MFGERVQMPGLGAKRGRPRGGMFGLACRLVQQVVDLWRRELHADAPEHGRQSRIVQVIAGHELQRLACELRSRPKRIDACTSATNHEVQSVQGGRRSGMLLGKLEEPRASAGRGSARQSRDGCATRRRCTARSSTRAVALRTREIHSSLSRLYSSPSLTSSCSMGSAGDRAEVKADNWRSSPNAARDETNRGHGSVIQGSREVNNSTAALSL